MNPDHSPAYRQFQALPPPMTVGRYVRENFKDTARKYIAWASLSIPVSGISALRMEGFEWWRLGVIPLAWVMACAGILVLVAAILAMAGAWKIHVRKDPTAPLALLMAAVVLVSVLVVTLY